MSVPPPDDLAEDGSSTLRDLIASVVHHEVAAFRQRQEDRQFIRVLTARQIEEGVEERKIASGESEVRPQEVDEEQAVATALLAFEDGIFLVVVDERDVRELDSPLFLQPDSRVTFVRMTLLAGG